MRVFLLCWDLAPYARGEAASAGRALVDGLLAQGIEVTCVLPEAVEAASTRPGDAAPEADLLIADAAPPPLPEPTAARDDQAPRAEVEHHDAASPASSDTGHRVGTVQSPRANIASHASQADDAGGEVVDNPYTGQTRRTHDAHADAYQRQTGQTDPPQPAAPPVGPVQPPPVQRSPQHPSPAPRPQPDPRHIPSLDDLDPLTAAQRFARRCVEVAKRSRFDLIHAIGPETLPAGVALAAISDRPLIAHIVQPCSDVPEPLQAPCHRGLRAADRVLAHTPAIRQSLVEHGELPESRISLLGSSAKPTPSKKGHTTAKSTPGTATKAEPETEPTPEPDAFISSMLTIYRGLVGEESEHRNP